MPRGYRKPTEREKQATRDRFNFLGNIPKAVGEGAFNFLIKPTVDTAQSVGRNIGTNLAAPSALPTYEKAAQAQTSQLDTLGVQLKAGKISKEQYKKAALGITQGSTIARDVQQFQQEADPVRTAGVAGNAALTLATFGKLPNITKNPLVSNLTSGADIGAGFGAAGTLQEQGERTNIADLLVNTGAGALFGGAFGAAGYAVPRVVKGAKKGNIRSELKKDIAPPVFGYKAGENLANELSKATTSAEVKNILKARVPADSLDKVAAAISQTKDPNIIKNILAKNTPDVTYVPTNSLTSYEGAPDRARVEFYKKQIQSEGTSPPLKVKPDSSGNIGVEDGKHRLQAYKELGFKRVPVEADTLPISQLGGQRPENVLQGTFETALNKGDLKGAQAAVDMIPEPDLKRSLQSILDTRKPQDIVSATTPRQLSGAALQSKLSVNPEQKVIESLRGVQSLRNKQEKLYTTERGKRFAAAQGAGEGLEGTAGFKAEVGQLKGKFQKVEWKGLKDNLGDDQAEKLYSDLRAKAKQSPDLTYTDKLNTDVALRKLILGEGLPTNSEIRRLKSVFGKDFASAVEEGTMPFRQKAKSLVTELLGAPRAILSTGDFSGGLRQALAYGTRHPIQFARQWVKQFKYFGEGLKKKDKAFQASLKEIQAHPDYSLAQKSKLAIVDIGGTNITQREEQFVGSGLVEKIPGFGRVVKGSSQAYAGLLNNIRANEFYRQLDRARAAGVPITDKLTKDLANVINTMTGRGSLGKLDQHMGALSSVLFAPRLMASRIQTLNPLYYAKLDPFVRREALTGLLSLGAYVGGILGLAKVAGLEVGTNPTSADFAKIKVGDTRFDIAGGFQQYVKLAAQLASGKITSSTTGNEIELGEGFGPKRLDIIYRFLEGKENPVVSFLTSLARGEDIQGNPTTTPEGVAREAVNRMIPLFVQDLTDVLSHEKAASPFVTTPLNIFGIGTQTYGVQDLALSDKQKATIEQLQKQGAPEGQIKATKSFYQTVKSGPDRNKASKNINEALAAGDTQRAIQIAKDYNQKYADSFKDWVEKHESYSTDKNLLKEYTSGKIKLTDSSIRQRLKNIKSNPLYAGE